MNTETQARPLFAARLTPNRSMSPRGIKIVIGLLCCLALLPGLIFYLVGAWPVVGFMGLDVLGLYWALTYSFRDGRRYEQVTLWADRLEVRQVSADGDEQTKTFNPQYVRLVIDRDFDERTTAIRLRSGEQEVLVGAFLNPDDKASFSRAFGSALRKARG
ncbi:MAG TPA: DUF2244 domain-containing protein [Devosiaceae bacterium]|nr:DUF2244 domain-containing protein [Devosiaceae bacterium]